jgi:hypothetical protein
MRARVFPEHDYDEVAYAEVEGVGVDQLRHLQHIIGGYVESVHTPRMDMKHNVLLVDEDARSKQRKPNFRATSQLGYPTILFGTVVVVGEVYNSREDIIQWGDINE